ncbi:MAG: D-Ala-D-Ala carboxypeptidase family metallohydrolase [Pseudomonadota bacterium]
MIYYAHWSHVPASEWRWPDFSPEELACRGTGKLGIDPDALDKLQALRTRLGRPMILNSAFRSAEYNRAIRAAKNSFHLKARAFDVNMANHDPTTFEAAARAVGFTGFGFYIRNNFMHVDTGPDREWGKRWPNVTKIAAPRFSPPPQPRPERVTDDPVVRGGALTTAGAVTALGGFASGLGNLSPTAQAIAVAGGLALLAGVAFVARDRLREWAS